MSTATRPTSSANAPNAAAKNRCERLETYSRANTMGTMTSADPRSGCQSINRMGNPTASANNPRVCRDSRRVPSWERVRTAAVKTSDPSFAPSEGWKENGPKSIQRVAPRRVTPSGVFSKSKGIRQATYTQWACLSQNL